MMRHTEAGTLQQPLTRNDENVTVIRIACRTCVEALARQLIAGRDLQLDLLAVGAHQRVLQMRVHTVVKAGCAKFWVQKALWLVSVHCCSCNMNGVPTVFPDVQDKDSEAAPSQG